MSLKDMMNALEWLNEQGSDLKFKAADTTAVLVHVEKFHPVTDELKEYMEANLPLKSIEFDSVRILSGDDIIEVSDSVDENGFLSALGYIVIGDHDNGVVVINANDASVHVVDLETLELTRAFYDEESDEYFWNGEILEDASDEFEMAFEGASIGYESFEEFDVALTSLLKGEIDSEEFGI